VIISPYKGAIVKPLSPEEVLDIGELRLAVIALVAKLLHGLAKQITAAESAREHFESALNRRALRSTVPTRTIRKHLLIAGGLLYASSCLANSYQVFYYLPTGNNGRQVIVIEASDSGAAKQIFQQLMPPAKFSECRRVP
jgi:hypothetical protein